MIHLVTGAAGFIGSHLVASLIARGHDVIGFDNLSRGKRCHIDASIATGHCTFIQAECADHPALLAAVSGAIGAKPVAALWHMAANSDIPAGVADPDIDLRDTFMTTYAALLVMKALDIPEFHFASSSAIYGDWGDAEIHENSAPYRPISNYGAMKLASEAQISATLEAHGRRASIFRFPNVVGAPATHGVIYDFILKLRRDPTTLTVLGDGTQQKAYLHVSDLVDAMHFVATKAPDKVAIYNVGPVDEGVTVRYIAETVRDTVSPNADIRYGQGNRGWVGDVPRFHYATARLSALGWSPRMTSAEAVARSIRDIATEI